MDTGELGHFSLLEKIGEGGMGRVYKAKDRRLERLVAIKLLAEPRRGDADRRARFIQEAKAASALNHPNIITIHEIGAHDGQTFIVMELVDGKPLNELIPRKGMPLTDALRIAVQVADALTAAHAAGIVHRDLKPANLMVDAHGRVKVLDFGLAKLLAPNSSRSVAADESTKTVVDLPGTEEGVILGSVPYMSPEQAEGRPVDARSDIFSFGAVLYEMITGQRAFRGESRASTLAAIVEKDPPVPSEISSPTPPELDRLVARCLRKDVHRRSQNMADVKLALEELRDESASGKLAGRAAVAPRGARRLMWPMVAIISMLIAAAASSWIFLNHRETQSHVPVLVRLSPDDGHSYSHATISPDGGFVAYISDRSGKDELWLQQVGGSEPIQLTHSSESVSYPSFFPDGKRILYVTTSADSRKSTIQVISALGGDSRLLIEGRELYNLDPMVSPDGQQIGYFEHREAGWRLVTASSNGGRTRELSNWTRIQDGFYGIAAWTSDSRNLVCLVHKSSQATDSDEFEWFAVPVDGGNPVATGAGDALRAAGLGLAAPVLMAGDRLLFYSGPEERINAWEISLSPGSWRVKGDPHQLTFGTLVEIPSAISTTSTVALNISKSSTDIYTIPLSPTTGQPTGVARRLTQDGRHKLLRHVGGDLDAVYFSEMQVSSTYQEDYYALDMKGGKQTLVSVLSSVGRLAVSPDGKHVAYSIPEGNSFSIRIGDGSAGAADARVLCKACGRVLRFSGDGRSLYYQPEATVVPDPKRKLSVRVLDVASGKDAPWLEHPIDSVGPEINTFGPDSTWAAFSVRPPGTLGPASYYIARCRAEAAPPAEWIRVALTPSADSILPARDFLYFLDAKLKFIRFNPKTRGIGSPSDVKFVPGSPVTFQADDDWGLRGSGLVFTREEKTSSVWLMKLPS